MSINICSPSLLSTQVPLFFGHTIPSPVEAKYCASIIKMWPAASGMGIKANFHVANIARLAGVHDLDAKCIRSTNPMNVAKAAYKAFQVRFTEFV